MVPEIKASTAIIRAFAFISVIIGQFLSSLSCISWANFLLSGFQVIADLFHIFPNFAFLVRISQQKRRMKRRHYFDAEIVLKMAPHFCNADLCVEQVMHRRVAHHDYHLWPDDRDLS